MSNPDPFSEIVGDFKRRLTDQEKRDFQICTLQDVEAEIDRIQKMQDAKRELRNLRRLESFLEAAQQFGQVVETFTNTSNMVAFIWGPMKLILQVASSWVYAFDQILEGYEKLGESFPMLKDYIGLFGERPELRLVLKLLYKDILEFHKKALRFFTRPAWRQVFRALWMDFKASFQHLLDNLDRHSRLLHDQAQTFHMLSARESSNEMKNALARLEQEQLAAKIQVEHDDRKRREEEKVLVLTWLAGNIAVTRDHHDDALRSRLENPTSGQWVLQNRIIEDWITEEFPRTSLVWMNGVPGAGKTVLASAIVEHCIGTLGANTAYFYCKHDDPDTLTSAGVLKTLLTQQVSWRNDLVPYLMEQRKDSAEPILSSDRLAASLFATVCKGSEKQYLIVDGIDECLPDQRAKLLNCLSSVVNDCDANEPGKLRVLVVSQNEKDIRRLLGTAAEVCISESRNLGSHQADIVSYCDKRACEIKDRYELDEAACLSSDMTIADVDDHMRLVALKAAGQFLYAKLVMENLLAQGSQYEFFEEIRSRRVPKGLAEAYERIIVRLQRKQSRWHDARLLFGWMTCAVRPLKWHEIQGIKSIDCNTEEVNFPLHSFRDDAAEICGSLIAIHGDRVMFMHSTARKFIAASAYIDLPTVRWKLTSFCLQYLSFRCFEPPLEDGSSLSPEALDHFEYVERGYFAFADYAVSAWMHHLLETCKTLQTLVESTQHAGALDPETFVQELEDAAEVFVDTHLRDVLGDDSQGAAISSENTYIETTKQYFAGVAGDSRNVQLLVARVLSLQSTTEGQRMIGIPSLEKSFTRMRKTIESWVSERSTSDETKSKLRRFYGDKLFKCTRPRCTFFHEGFTDTAIRNHHVRRHDRPFQCDVVGCTSNDFAFSNKADLKRHVEEFHPDADIKARLFKIPEATHKLTTQWVCTKCNKSFARNSILHDHELAHTKQKPHLCRFCDKAFTRKSDRIRHEKQHENRIQH